MHLKTTKTLCKNYWKTGKIVPISCNFPSFSITTSSFKSAILDVVTDKIRFIVENNFPNNQQDYTYDEILKAESSRVSTIKDKKIITYYNENFFKSVENNIVPQAVVKNALISLCTNAMYSKLCEIESLSSFSDKNILSSCMTEQDKFCATLILMAKKLPSISKSVDHSLDLSCFSKLFNQLKNTKTNTNIIQHLEYLDEDLFKEHFQYPNKMVKSCYQI